MYRDEIIEEVWCIRDAYVNEHQNDLKRIIEDLMLRQEKTAFQIVDRRLLFEHKQDFHSQSVV
ncbi:MAG: hypothetical protein U5R49_19770 [Deltaproteobacteria bacterium]|nr:hypothetical protein [Deltaproteobacteria bacterium]